MLTALRSRRYLPPAPLRQSRLGDLLPKQELRTMSLMGTQVNVPAHTKLISEGSVGREFLVLIDGVIGVSRQNRPIAGLSAGHFVGEGALLENRPRNASVTTTADSALYAFNRREFAALMDDCPRLAKHIQSTAMKREPPEL